MLFIWAHLKRVPKLSPLISPGTDAAFLAALWRPNWGRTSLFLSHPYVKDVAFWGPSLMLEEFAIRFP